MAQAAGLLDQEQFSCTICLDLLKDPVAIPCGHSYCLGCIKGCWDQDDHTGVYSCPQCRETFTPRPVLRKNTILAEVVEKLKKTGLQAAPPAHCYAGPGDVACDVCTGKKRKAVKSCLVCLASYCGTHLILHDELNPGKRHQMIEASGNLQEKICTHHDKLLEVYCRTDQQCICSLCVIDEHKGHDTVSAMAEWTEKQKQLGPTQSKFQQRIQEREKELQDLRQAVQSLKHSAQAAVEETAEKLLEQLEQEIAELRRKDTELEQLSHTEDHIHFLQSSKSLWAPPGPGDLPNIAIKPNIYFEAAGKCVSELKERLEDVCKGKMSKTSKAAAVETCPLCMGTLKKKLRLMCTHTLCAACLRNSVYRLGLQCPVCLKALRVLGDQPEGQMRVKYLKDCFGKNCFSITYNIPSGKQTEVHPNPGKPFTGIQTEAWLPDEERFHNGLKYMTLLGQEVLKLLQRAFDQKMMFTVAATHGAADRVVFNGIPHAGNLYECRETGFLRKVKEALSAKYIE